MSKPDERERHKKKKKIKGDLTYTKLNSRLLPSYVKIYETKGRKIRRRLIDNVMVN